MTFPSDYRDVLRIAFVERCKRNSRYSLRAFARDLKISPARLSGVMNRRFGLSVYAAQHISDRIGLGPSERVIFCRLVESQHARDKIRRSLARDWLQTHYQEPRIRALQLDRFHWMADWYHFAILELSITDAFKSDSAWIADTLGISKDRAQDAVDRLLRLKLLKWDRRRLRPTEDFSFVGQDIPSAGIKEFHKGILTKAEAALHFQHISEREFGAWILAIHTRDLPAAKKTIRQFQKDFCRKFGRLASQKDPLAARGRDAVYCVSTQFFRLADLRKTTSALNDAKNK